MGQNTPSRLDHLIIIREYPKNIPSRLCNFNNLFGPQPPTPIPSPIANVPAFKIKHREVSDSS